MLTVQCYVGQPALPSTSGGAGFAFSLVMGPVQLLTCFAAVSRILTLAAQAGLHKSGTGSAG